MKKIFTLMLIVLVAVGTAYAAQPLASPGIGDILGQAKFPSDPNKIFRLVRYMPSSATDNTATLAAESIVIWDSTSDDGVTVTTTTTSYDSRVAGIIAIAAQTPDFGAIGQTAYQDTGRRNWTWLQTYGKAECRVGAAGGVTVGQALGASATAGEAAEFLPSASSSSANGNAGFWFDSATKAADNVECFVRLD